MPKPVKHREMLRRLRALGWDGPYHRGPHPFTVSFHVFENAHRDHEPHRSAGLRHGALGSCDFAPCRRPALQEQRFMVRGEDRLTIPNPHCGDIDWSLMKRLLRQAGISAQDWDSL